MPNNEEIPKEGSEVLLKDQVPSPPSDEWIPLIEASRILGLKSIRQVYRRIEKHGIQHKRVVSGTRVRSYVRREDVIKSRKLALEESQISDMSEELSDVTSVRRQGDVGLQVIRDVIPQLKEFISNTGNKLEKIEAVRGLLADLLTLTREEREERLQERGERRQEREATIKAKEQERKANLVRLICYVITSLLFCGFVIFVSWMFYTGKLFRW